MEWLLIFWFNGRQGGINTERFKTYESNFCIYFDNLYNSIKQSNVKVYNLNKLLNAFGNYGSKDTIVKNFKLKNDVLTKSLTLKILDYMRLASKRYNKKL